MLPKKNRVDKKTLDLLFKEGKNAHSSSFHFKYILNLSADKRISVVAPKNIARLATKRNQIRRLGYQIIQENLSQIPKGLVGAMVFKKKPEEATDLDNEFKEILKKIGR